jgi:uncharacterized protein (DUF1330 family)
MAAYMIAEVEVVDPIGYEEYRAQVSATVAQFGGKYLVRGGACTNLEGEWNPKRLVVLEFESTARAREWWDSEQYRPVKAIRQRTARSKLLLVEGVD